MAEKINGYRELSAKSVGMINRAKALEGQFNKLIDDMRACGSDYDQRNVALAQTEGETAFMRAVRAIAQPERIVG